MVDPELAEAVDDFDDDFDDALLELAEAVDELAEFTDERPLEYVRWTPPQLALLSSTAKRTMLRTGNQFGKTWAGLAETIFRCLGRHPFKRVRPAPIEAWIITSSWSQSLAIQAKLWALVPKDELVEGCVFDPVNGFPGATPVVRFTNGSIIRIKTSGQGGLRLASASVPFILADEPLPSARIYSELDRRLTRTAGDLFLTMTPVNAPVDWVRELAEERKIADLHFEMTPANFVPVGSSRPLTDDDGTPIDQDWIDQQRASVLSWEAPVILDGQWEFRAAGRRFENYVSSKHVVPSLLSSTVGPPGDAELALGLDYGEDRLRTAGVLIAVSTAGRFPVIWVLDEYVPDKATTIDEDAAGLVRMLARNGFRWEQLDHVHGDKRYTDAAGRLTKKSNSMLMAAVEAELGLERGLRPRAKGAKRGRGAGRGAVYAGIKWLNSAMIRPGHFFVDRRCRWGDECLNRWDGTEKSKYKDWIDGLRYAAKPYIFPRGRRGNTVSKVRTW